ncbi:MAG: hypothetical protein AAB276_02325 [Pseudomonadota bacterium]
MNNTIKTPEAGQLVAGKGVFVGPWLPVDREGHCLSKLFNIFAAPYDLGFDENGQGTRRVKTYIETVNAVARIRNLMGHDGANYDNDTALYNALKDGSYKGKWFIPPSEILNGTDVDMDHKIVRTATLYDLRDTGAFRGTFPPIDFYPFSVFWSSTDYLNNNKSRAYVATFRDGNGVDFCKDGARVLCRPVRLELVP